MAACFDDYRDPGRTEHGLGALLRQRVFGTGMDYEDLNDHDRIRRIRRQMKKSRARCVKRREASRRFVGFRYRTLDS